MAVGNKFKILSIDEEKEVQYYLKKHLTKRHINAIRPKQELTGLRRW